MRVAISNLKGGVGKTTTAVYLSQHLSGTGRTLLVDLDPQASCLDWGNAATRAGEPLGAELVALAPQGADTFRAVLRPIDSLAAGYDHVVIDTPPGDRLMVAAAMSAADIVVIPTRPSKLEVARVGATAELAESAGRPIAVLMTSRAGAKALGLARQALQTCGYPVVPEVIPLREAISTSYGHRPDARYIGIFGQVARVLDLALAA
jgi:chromosome partitioning protein